MSADLRPTSPHLSIYRPQISSVLSILHRLTGIWLSAGAVVVALWLYVVAYAPGEYSTWHGYLASWVGQLLMLSWVISFYYHLFSGIRHLFWDIGMGFRVPQVHASGWLVILMTGMLTALTWGFVHSTAGGL